MIKRIILKWMLKNGYLIFKPKRVNNSFEYKIGDFTYGFNVMNATYAPWVGDTEFMKVYDVIKSNTLVDIFRCYELWKLGKDLLNKFPNSSILEIGVWRGGTAAIFYYWLNKYSAKNKLYLADTFTGVVKSSEADKSYTDGEHSDTSIDIVTGLLSNWGTNGYTILKGIFPEETSNLVAQDSKFCLCHIDVDVYLSAKDCFNWVWDKLEVGGVVVFDDYGFLTCDGITKFVEEQRNYKDRIVIHNLNGHGIIVKI